MAGLFDDLIPAQPPSAAQLQQQPQTPLSFGDLISMPKPPEGAVIHTSHDPMGDMVAQPDGTLKEAHPFNVLPVSLDQNGRPQFDSNAGILGSIKSAVGLPGDVYDGKVDPNSNEALGRAVNLAGLISPGSVAGSPTAFNVPFTGGPAKVATPSVEELRAAANAGYSGVRDAGLDFSGQSVADMAARARADLENRGIIDELAPGSFSVLNKLENPPAGSVAPITGMEAARRAFGNAGRNFSNPTDQLAASLLADHLDNFVSNPPEGAVVGGNSDAISQALQDARGNYGAAKRSEQLQGVQDTADLRAAAANSGKNIGNSVRSRIASLLTNGGKISGYSPDEVAALENVTNGSFVRNRLRDVGNLLGGGGGLGQMAGAWTGAAAGGPLGAAAVPAIGMAAKAGDNALTQRALALADELVRQRSPLYNQKLKNAPVTPPTPVSADDLARIIMGGSQQQQ